MLMKMVKTVRNVSGATSLLMLLAVGSAGAQTTWSGPPTAKLLLTTFPFEPTSNLLVYKTNVTSTFDTVLGTTNVGAGKVYLEYTLNTPISNSNIILGMCSTTQTLASAYPGLTAGTGFGLQTQGTVYSVGGTSGWNGGTATFSTVKTYVVGLAVDIGAKKFWVRINLEGTAASWLNGDPVAGTGGGTYTISGAVTPCVGLFGSTLALPAGTSAYTAAVYLNAGTHAFRDAAPTGYSAFGTVATPEYSLTTIASRAWDTNVAYKSPSVTLSGSNLITTIGATGLGVTYPTQSNFASYSVGTGSGDIYVEATVLNVGTSSPEVGFQIPLITQYNNTTTYGASWSIATSGSNFRINGVGFAPVGSATTGDILRFAISASAKKIWVAKGCAGAWQLGTSPDPATHSGGADISSVFNAMNGALVFAVLNTDSSSFGINQPYSCTNPFPTTANHFLPLLGAGQ